MAIPARRVPGTSKSRVKPKNLEELIRHFILDHSEELFISRGYMKTSMDTIAKACGLSKPTLYNYFHGKHEIFTELYQRLYRGLYDKIKVLLTLDKDKSRILRAVIDEYFAWVAAKRDFLQMYFREQHLVIHEDIQEHMDWHARSKREMVGLLSQSLEGIMRPDLKKKYGVEMAASIVLDIFDGLIADPSLPSAEALAAQKAFLVEFLRQGVIAGGR